MTHPTERHDFTFGCYRSAEVPSIDDGEDTDATDAADDPIDATEEPTPVTDGGALAATTCPACENDLANVQGVPACTDCTWTAR